MSISSAGIRNLLSDKAYIREAYKSLHLEGEAKVASIGGKKKNTQPFRNWTVEKKVNNMRPTDTLPQDMCMGMS